MKKNFTLIEILVVATVIGLLSTVISISYSQLTKESRNNRRKTDLEQLRSALEMYRSNNDVYPDSLSFLTTPTIYIQSIPTDPKAPIYNYNYTKISDIDYVLGTYLEGVNSSCASIISCGSANCNYCLGPYGRK